MPRISYILFPKNTWSELAINTWLIDRDLYYIKKDETYSNAIGSLTGSTYRCVRLTENDDTSLFDAFSKEYDQGSGIIILTFYINDNDYEDPTEEVHTEYDYGQKDPSERSNGDTN